jgi:hypothetical protein
MSQMPHANVPPRRQSNGWGLAGFIVSLVGFISCGCLSPIGLLLSIIGLFKEPRGFAIAGLVLGLLGSIGAFFIFFVFGFAALLAAIGFAAIAMTIELGTDATTIQQAVNTYQASNGAMPIRIEDLQISDPDIITDPWGVQYVIQVEVDADGVETHWLVSAGPDMAMGTSDDLQFMNLNTGEVNDAAIEQVLTDEYGR